MRTPRATLACKPLELGRARAEPPAPRRAASGARMVFETGCTGFLSGRCLEQLLGAISWDELGEIDLKSGVNLFPGAGGVPWKRGTGPPGPGEHPPFRARPCPRVASWERTPGPFQADQAQCPESVTGDSPRLLSVFLIEGRAVPRASAVVCFFNRNFCFSLTHGPKVLGLSHS